VTAICLFAPGLVRGSTNRRPLDDERYGDFLSAGLGIDLSPIVVRRWRSLEDQLAGTFSSVLGEPRDWLSSAEQVGLALPFLEHPPTSVADAEQRLERFASSVDGLHAAGDEQLLALVAEYGRRWEMIVETELPLNEPATIKVGEDRPLKIGWSGRCQHLISLGDAVSYHAEVSLDDPNLEFVGEPEVVTLDGEEIGRPPVEGVLVARRVMSLYSAHPDKPYYGEIRFRVRPTRDLRWVTRALILLLLPALGVGLWLDPAPDRDDVVSEMGVVAVATTLAVALLLIREATPLAARLLRLSRGAVLLGMLGVWAVVLLRIASWSGL
jgi:hypothetical protein